MEEIAPAEPKVHTNLSLFYLKIGDKEEAERQKALATLGELSAAAEYQDRALAQQEQNGALYASYGRVLERVGRTYLNMLLTVPKDFCSVATDPDGR